MKKLFAIVGGLALSLCVILSGCGHNMVEPSMRCLFCEDKFKLPIKNKALLEDGNHVSLEGRLDEMKEKIDRADYGEAHVTTYLFGNFLTIEKQDEKNRTHYYNLFQKGDERIYLSDSTELLNCGGNMYQWVVLPFHFLDSDEILKGDHVWPTIDNGVDYSTSHTISEFAAFYEKLDELTVRIEENNLIAEMKEPITMKYKVIYWRLAVTFSETGVAFTATAL